MLVDPDEIPLIFSQKTYIEVASDGGHDPRSGISTFGWVIAADKTLIAKGRGPAEAHPSLAESFRSEGYGLSSALIFIQNLKKEFNIQLRDHKITIHIDNMALIQRMEGCRTQVPVPRWNLRSDEDITRLAHSLLTTTTNIIHVHSHQDDDKDWEKLSFPAQLNIMADEEATHHREMMDGPATMVTNIARAQLRIQNMAITRDSQRLLLQAAGKIPLKQYYADKHGWTSTIFDAISWKSQHKALEHFDINDQTRILKFVHGWLPTQNRLFKEGAATSPRCKICTELYENNSHLLCCQHPAMKAIQEDLTTFLMRQLADHGNSELINILQIALEESRYNPK